MPERSYNQQPEQEKVIKLYPDAPTPIWDHPNYREHFPSKMPLAYDIQLDIKEWETLSQLEGQIPPAEYAALLVKWHAEKLVNLETHLGERLNAQLFETYYLQKDGRFQNPFRNETAVDMIVQGQQYRLGESLNLNHDQKRELAEVISFTAVEAFFLENPKSTDKLIVPSPPGGNYGGNFIDVFNLTDDGVGKKALQMRRFAVGLSQDQHWQVAQKLAGSLFPPSDEKDIDLKSTALKTSRTDQEILDLYFPDAKALSLEDYDKAKVTYLPWAKAYIKAVMAKKSKGEIGTTLNAGLKYIDVFMDKDSDETGTISPKKTYESSQIQYLIPILGAQQVRAVVTGCGSSGGPDSESAKTVADFAFGIDIYGTRKLHCQTCGATYQRHFGVIEPNCRFCGGKDGIAC